MFGLRRRMRRTPYLLHIAGALRRDPQKPRTSVEDHILDDYQSHLESPQSGPGNVVHSEQYCRQQ